MQTQFAQAIEQICEEKNIDKGTVMEAVEAALAAAYKKDYGERDQEVRVNINEESGGIEVFVSKEVVEEVDNPNLEISISAASKIKKDVKVGDVVEIMDLPADFGRIAAQTAKQVIVQRIREAERDMVFSEYKDKEGSILNCIVQRVEGDTVICDLGKASAVLYKNEQIPNERYYPNQRFRVYLVKVEQTARGPQIVVSRSHPGMVKKLFESEVPEIAAGIVEVMGVSREAGGRTKIAVKTTEEGVDPVGSFVGQRGIRVQSVMNEIGGEKIDIILYNEDPKTYIENALSPAKISEISIDEETQKALVKVPEDQLSLAIGKQGQNVRLAAKLTGWNIDIEGSGSAIEEIEGESTAPKRVTQKQDLEAAIINAVKDQQNNNNEEVVTEATEVSEEKIESTEEDSSEESSDEALSDNQPAESGVDEPESSQENLEVEEEITKKTE